MRTLRCFGVAVLLMAGCRGEEKREAVTVEPAVETPAEPRAAVASVVEDGDAGPGMEPAAVEIEIPAFRE